MLRGPSSLGRRGVEGDNVHGCDDPLAHNSRPSRRVAYIAEGCRLVQVEARFVLGQDDHAKMAHRAALLRESRRRFANSTGSSREISTSPSREVSLNEVVRQLVVSSDGLHEFDRRANRAPPKRGNP
jgi:hypothetical protein